MSPWGLPMRLPSVAEPDFRSDRAGGVLDDRQAVLAADRQNAREITGHAHLVDAQNGSGPRGDRALQCARIEVEG